MTPIGSSPACQLIKGVIACPQRPRMGSWAGSQAGRPRWHQAPGDGSGSWQQAGKGIILAHYCPCRLMAAFT